MSDKRYFHFTIGPVQGFVAQARRTRDFWAGSFLLSWLSGVAMQASIEQNATIEFPKANQNYLNWLTGGGEKNKEPRQGSIPNRFKAEVEGNFQPELVTKSVQDAWNALAKLIYDNDIAKHANPETKRIWNGQIKAFWEISWAISNEKKDSSILDQRKNWRSYRPPPQDGVKCMMMDGWQELSGTSTPHSKALSSFWKSIRNNQQKGMLSDLYEGESLCAIAFVKRRFVRYFEDLKGVSMPGGWKLYGWKLKPGVPSVSYLAAVHWLEEAMKQANENPKVKEGLLAFDAKAHELTHDRGEWDTDIQCITDLINSGISKRWASHDGNVFFPTILENKKLYPDQEKAKKVIEALQKLNKAVDISTATPFYAVLMMDGDSLGKQMSVVENQQNISTALDNFTKKVPGIVKKKNGFLIYAGGDDVLAILPLEDAMECAVALRCWYSECFTPYEKLKNTTSLSGAIEYAHIKMPLTKVLHDAHDLLDNVAKERTGRNALAVRVWKPGGTALEWAQPWDIVQKNQSGVTEIEKLVNIFREKNETDPQFSNKFFYKIRDRFSILNPSKEGKDPTLLFDQRTTLMAMEYINSGKNRKDENGHKLTMEEAVEKIHPLIEQCTPQYRDADGVIQKTDFLKADGALLIRFLAQKGVRQ